MLLKVKENKTLFILRRIVNVICQIIVAICLALITVDLITQHSFVNSFAWLIFAIIAFVGTSTYLFVLLFIDKKIYRSSQLQWEWKNNIYSLSILAALSILIIVLVATCGIFFYPNNAPKYFPIIWLIELIFLAFLFFIFETKCLFKHLHFLSIKNE